MRQTNFNTTQKENKCSNRGRIKIPWEQKERSVSSTGSLSSLHTREGISDDQKDEKHCDGERRAERIVDTKT